MNKSANALQSDGKGTTGKPLLWAYASLSGLCQDVLEGDISLGCSCDHHRGSKQLAHELRGQADADSYSLWRDAIPDDAHQVIVRREVQDRINKRFVLHGVGKLAVSPKRLRRSFVLERKARLATITTDRHHRVVIFRVPVAGQILRTDFGCRSPPHQRPGPPERKMHFVKLEPVRTALLNHVYVSASREQLARIDQHGGTVLADRVHLVPPACQPGTFLDQAMADQPPEPVIECLPRTFRLFQPHELVQLIAGNESRSQDLLQQRDVPRWAQFHGSFFVTHRPFLTLPGLPFPAEGRRTRTASWKAPRKTYPVPRVPRSMPASTASPLVGQRFH